MSQPPLSQAIQRLEDSLGCKLFMRSRRRVELTLPGKVLLRHVQKIFADIEYARRSTVQAAGLGPRELLVGYTPSSLSGGLPKVIRVLRDTAPGLDVSMRQATTSEQIQGLLDGRLDFGFFLPQSKDIEGLVVRIIRRTRPVAAIPSGLALSRKPYVSLADLADHPLMLFPESIWPEFHARLYAAFRDKGLQPSIFQEATYDHARLGLVAAGMGISLIDETAAPEGYPGVVMRPIRDLPPGLSMDAAMGWRSGGGAEAERLFERVYETARDPALAAASAPGA